MIGNKASSLPTRLLQRLGYFAVSPFSLPVTIQSLRLTASVAGLYLAFRLCLPVRLPGFRLLMFLWFVSFVYYAIIISYNLPEVKSFGQIGHGWLFLQGFRRDFAGFLRTFARFLGMKSGENLLTCLIFKNCLSLTHLLKCAIIGTNGGTDGNEQIEKHQSLRHRRRRHGGHLGNGARLSCRSHVSTQVSGTVTPLAVVHQDRRTRRRGLSHDAKCPAVWWTQNRSPRISR